MARAREDFIRPVGFATEPTVERRRWIGRIMLGVLVVLLGFILLNRVIDPPEDTPRIPVETELPGPR